MRIFIVACGFSALLWSFFSLGAVGPAISTKLPIILDLIDAETNDDLQLASQVLALTNRKAVIDVPLAEKALKIVKNDGPIVLRSSAPAVEIEDRGRESRFWAAEEYMVWSSQFQTISKALEKPILDEARLYETTLQSLESNKPENGNGDLYARACIRALISLNKSMYGRGTPLEKRVSPDVQDTLQRFRVDPKLLAELSAIEGENDYSPLGEVPLEWVEKRIMGVGTANGEYADICSSEWISRLRIVLAGHLEKFGLDDLDASVLQMTAPRNLTQLVSRVVFSEKLAGIYYRSKYGHDVENWALFEPFQINAQDPEPIRFDDPDLQRALRLHSLKFKK